MGILSSLFGDANEGVIKEARKLVEKVNELEPSFESLSDTELKEKAQELQESAQEDILAASFALVREAAKRTLGQRHFDVQLIGGVILNDGKIAEMRTGEGKTLASTLPVFLNALEKKGVHVITVNDYLAKRDTVWMGQIYHALGLSIGCIMHASAFVYDPSYMGVKEQGGEADTERDATGNFKVLDSYLRPVGRKEAYEADITYGTNNEFGFDYLRDNMAYDAASRVQRGYHFAVVDEIDSVLIDEARTPLIISAPDEESSEWYKDFARIIPQLKAETDYAVDEKLKAVTLTENGIDKVEKILGMKDIYEDKGIKYLHYLESALRAQAMFQKDKDYVVKTGQIIIVDEFTGRLLPGRRFSGGLHQALEAKERVQVQAESVTLASITFQNYFRMYDKLAGMTGTAITSAEEFSKVYGLEVIAIPTNKELVRKDMPDRVYKTETGKYQAVAREIQERHKTGQPVLVGTVSIQKNEYLGKLLEKEGIPHQMLNAKNHEEEGQIIAQAGRKGAVTIATNMAGRGVDIILGGNPTNEEEAKEVKSLGGLHVIGTQRHDARRIDNQLRGRSGRQGDPGSSQFFISLEDDLVRVFGGERIKGIMDKLKIPEDEAIESKMISNAIESAQSKIEGMNFDARKHLLEYDDVLNKHREGVYEKRAEIFEKAEVQDPQDEKSLRSYLLGISEKHGFTPEMYVKKEQELGEENMRQAEKISSFRVIDSLWMRHLEDMEALRDSVRLRAYGQQDPLMEYKNEGHRMFKTLLESIDAAIVHSLFHAQVTSRRVPTQTIVQQTNNTSSGVGRNDPCPCGSGKKWKKCGMIEAPEHKK